MNEFLDSIYVEKESMNLDSLDLLFFLLSDSVFGVIFEDEKRIFIYFSKKELVFKIIDIEYFLEKSCLVEILYRN